MNSLLWVLLGVYTLITLSAPFLSWSSDIYALLVVSLSTLFAFLHGSKRYGTRGMVVFAVFCLVISNFMENLGIATGFPFGHYEYSEILGPKLFAVPLIIGPAYFSVGYLAWAVANVLLGIVEAPLKKFYQYGLPIIAAFVMVMWDLVMDPASSTMRQLWIWQGGGGFFGVPLTNFLGWFLTVYLFFQAFAFYLVVNPKTVKHIQTKSYFTQAVLFYLVIGLGFIASYLVETSGIVVDVTGTAWNRLDIRETSVIVSLFTMCFVSLLALIKLHNQEHQPLS